MAKSTSAFYFIEKKIYSDELTKIIFMKKSSFANKSIGVITVSIIYILSLETSLIAQVNTVRKLKALSTLKSKPVSTYTKPVLKSKFC